MIIFHLFFFLIIFCACVCIVSFWTLFRLFQAAGGFVSRRGAAYLLCISGADRHSAAAAAAAPFMFNGHCTLMCDSKCPTLCSISPHDPLAAKRDPRTSGGRRKRKTVSFFCNLNLRHIFICRIKYSDTTYSMYLRQ